MSVRINFEIGHEAAIRTKPTTEGFTHDWEVFVRGCDGASIHYYVEKVVFYLHETFLRPKRVVKEPPYTVKESGYAGFALPIEIHLRNKDEPKKITFNYDLHLQPNGAPISEVQNKKHVFNMPGEDFKLKLLQGGGVIVNSQEITSEPRSVLDDKMLLISKPKLGGSEVIRKHKTKIEEPRNSFHELFGAPITKTSKVAVDTKQVVKNKNPSISKSGSGEKEKSKYKHSPHKEKDKEKFREKDLDKVKNRDEKKREEKKERSKDHEERKEKKERREKSPKGRSPTPTKRVSSPTPKHKDKEDKKVEVSKERKTDEREKFEKKLKKEKRDKEKDRKESKYKEREQKSTEQKENKSLLREKEKHKEPSPLPPKNGGKEKLFKEKDILKDFKESKDEQVDKDEKVKIEKNEEKSKHKHKRKDRDKKDKEKLVEKSYKSEKKLEKGSTSKYNEPKYNEPKYNESIKEPIKEPEKSLFNSPKQMSSLDTIIEKPKKPLGALMAEFADNNSSNSSISSHEDLFNEPPPIAKQELKKDHSTTEIRIEEDSSKPKKEKSKKNKDKKSEKSSERKRKRKSDSTRVEEPLEKIPKEESSNSKASDTDNFVANDKQEEENYEDYMNILRDLQHKILTLQDNSELQRVVQLIAETGRFEVSAQTFDFDLCLLERSTITQLQNFFQSTS